MPIFASNFASNSLSGTARVVNGFANITLPTIPYALEGDKSFVIKIRKDSVTGDVLSTSPVLTFKDTSSFVSLTANVSSVAEGNLVAFTLVTANAVNGANLFYSVFPVTANVTAGDFTANTGTFTITNNAGTFALKANADVSLSNEDGETFRVQLRTNDSVGNVVFVTSNVVILDTYKTYNVLSFVENSSPTIVEGTSVTFTFTATNIPAGTILYYNTSGNTTSFTSNTGSFVMNSTSNTFTITNPQVPFNATRAYSAVVRDGSAQGAIVVTSNTINVIDETLVPLSASGGVQSNISGHRIHIFTTSGNIAFNKTGFVEYLVIAGGGGGAYGGGTNTLGGGGGGAGGLIYKNSTSLASATLSVIIGAGGTAPGGQAVAVSGSPSIFNADTAIGGGGGGGVQRMDGGSPDSPGSPGGSGGGGMYGTTGQIIATNYGFGTSGQGNPGGAEHTTYVRNSGGGGGAGASGGGGASPTAGGIGLTANSNFNLPSSYGTPGPAPGRYFAGGGGGGKGSPSPATGHEGSSGGGGSGSGSPTGIQAGTTNTGGGGGGGSTSTGGNGGSGIVIIKYSTNVAIPTFNVTTSANNIVANSIIEGGNIVFTLNTTDLSNNTLLYYYTLGNVISSDFVTGNTGSFRTTQNRTNIILQSNTNIPLNQERFLQLVIAGDTGTSATPLITSNVFTINDAILTYNVTTPTTFIYDVENIIFTLNTTNVSNNTLLYYYTVGNVLTTNFVTGNIGSFRTTQNRTNITLTSNVSIPANEQRILQLVIAGEAGTSATPLITSNVITIRPSITFSAETLAIGGGGGGGGYPPNSVGGAGGGAGGVILTNVTISTSTTYTVSVPGSAAGGVYTNDSGFNGSNTILSGGAISITAVGGGGGLNQNIPLQPGRNGGSGGGGRFENGQPEASLAGGGGYGFPSPTQQGYPGGAGASSFPNNQGGGGGAGGAGGPGSSGGGHGGLGINSSITGVNVQYAGGGGGGSLYPGAVGGYGQYGGGNSGWSGSGPGDGRAANVNTGGGGGGAGRAGGSQMVGGDGGSGIVILAYANTLPNVVVVSGNVVISTNTTSRPGYLVHRFIGGTGTFTFR